MNLRVCEIFYSIQGESSFAGLPCIFIRLAGCNLRCSYCDTRYALIGGESRSLDDILQSIARYPCRLVEITGGEPLLQEGTVQLTSALLNRNYSVLLETNGSIVPEDLDRRCIKIVDVKCPASGEQDSFNSAVLDVLTERDELKFVISDRGDYEFALAFLQSHPGISPSAVHFSPVLSRLPASELAFWILADGLRVRLSPQLHRFIWPHAERGV